MFRSYAVCGSGPQVVTRRIHCALVLCAMVIGSAGCAFEGANAAEDGAGRDAVAAKTSALADPAADVTYEYDGAGRLRQAYYESDHKYVRYIHDRAGNRTRSETRLDEAATAAVVVVTTTTVLF